MEPLSEQDVSTADARLLISSTVLAWNAIEKLLQDEHCIIDGRSLNISTVVAVAKYGILTQISIDTEIDKSMKDSVSMLRNHLDSGHLVYGVSTG
ncbi:hypothetical protein KCU89_g12001, partial [Aureobasidium melanogenum]